MENEILKYWPLFALAVVVCALGEIKIGGAIVGGVIITAMLNSMPIFNPTMTRLTPEPVTNLATMEPQYWGYRTAPKTRYGYHPGIHSRVMQKSMRLS